MVHKALIGRQRTKNSDPILMTFFRGFLIDKLNFSYS